MKHLPRPALIGFGIVGVALLAVAIGFLRFTGTLRSFDTGFAGTCASVAAGGSSEDIRLDRKRGLAYLSVLDRAALARHEPALGTVMLLDLNLAAPAPRAALTFDPANFRPQGLSLLNGEPERLFAISLQADGHHAVQIAERDPGGAFFPRDAITDPAFVHPNALAAVGPRQFYLVNDSDTAQGRPGMSELLLGQGRGTLLWFDGKQAHVLESGLRFPAGLALSPDAARLYVGEALAHQVRIYRRDTGSGALTLEEIVALPAAPDNLDVDDEGVLWIAAHPRLLAFVAHARDPGKPAPTQVLRFDPRGPRPTAGEKDARLSQVFGNDGSLLSAGSVAAHWRDEFLVGAVFDHKVLICKPSP